MELSPQRMEAVVEKLKQYWGADIRCSVCGSREFGVSDRVFELREYNGTTALSIGGQLMPILAATCKQCGDIRLVSAIAMGAIDPKSGDAIDG